MMSKSLYFSIISYVVLMVLAATGSAYSYFGMDHIFPAVLGLVVLFVLSILLIRYLNKTNRRLAYFIDSIRNNDTSVQFPGDIRNKPVMDLYNSLKILNDLIRKVKIESSYNEQLLKTLIEYSSTGFITIDENGDFEVLNHHARRYLGVEYTSNLTRLKQEDARLYHIFETIGPGENRIHRVQREDQFYQLSISAAEIKYYNKKFKVISMQDISRELDEQEIESWHKLFRVITHEIMNSIAPITSLSNTLTRLYQKNGHKKQPGEVSEKNIEDTINGLKVIDDMGNGLMNFVQNYRQLNKIPKPNRVKINLQPWLENLKTFTGEIIRDKDIQLQITMDNNCKTIYGDEKLLNQVMLNLVMNSVDALEGREEKKIAIKVNLGSDGKTVITTSDNGKGLTDEDLERVFVPFFTTKDNGNGIGLSLAKQILKLHGGVISMRSKPDKGTQVMITI
ncbi:MAG: hypothetical protein GVY19_01140 [Bacteroidetes bacterium]|jgi:nitrogen fixation/metabolism regulation signal transduction histidine kinase|nr:hypothetical protein [Bacteroidota bacterium]